MVNFFRLLNVESDNQQHVDKLMKTQGGWPTDTLILRNDNDPTNIYLYQVEKPGLRLLVSSLLFAIFDKICFCVVSGVGLASQEAHQLP